MAEHKHLEHAPITEAIIDFRVKLPKEFHIEKFSVLKEELRDQYPKVKDRRLFEGHHEIKNGKLILHPLQEKGLHGYFFATEDEKNIAQFRIDGFTFSRLKPYTCWENIFSEAQKLWKLYQTKASPDSITRIAVRYINHLKIPLPIHDFAEYLTAPPVIPDELPRSMSSFLTRIVIHDLEQDLAANVTQALERSTEPNFAIIILDIDVFKQKEFDIDSEEIWSTFEQLHEMKNLIFFKSITDKTMRLFA